MNIYVGNLPKTVSEEEVRKLFETHGAVGAIKLIKDHFTEELRGFGFVEMPNKSEAQTAIQQLDGTELQGKTLIVNEARSRKDRSSGPRGGGGRHRDSRSRSW